MIIEFRFLTYADLNSCSFDAEADSEQILQSGKLLYDTSISNNPNRNNSSSICLAIVDGKIVGRFVLFQSELKVGDKIIPIQTGGGILVSEKYRGYGIGSSLI